ncbi:4,5-dihydroxyphthalate decarboxylase [Streptomyces sp. NPDC051576]|uniref:4,5-dihydroxyphthalate decarboxylase n=1 Tax=Streptomyces sp. NPDC051576 TaxID=3155803 RepID=UPI0034256CA8
MQIGHHSDSDGEATHGEFRLLPSMKGERRSRRFICLRELGRVWMSATEKPPCLSAAVGSHEHTKRLVSCEVGVPGYALEFVDVSPIIAAFRRMVRRLEFDVCELAPTTYMVAREAGVEITALPVFLGREFHFTNIVCGAGSGIEKPSDLCGRRVGVRAYTVSTGVWARSLLRTEYGMDANLITWIVDDEEHVESFELPGNVRQAPAGVSLADLFDAGEIDAAFTGPAGIGRSGPPREGWDESADGPVGRVAYPLFENTDELARAYYRTTGVYPLHGVVVVKNSVVRQHPDFCGTLREALEAAKQPFLASLREAEAEAEAEAKGAGKEFEHFQRMRSIVGDDPLPYGIEANLPSIDALLDAAVDQNILRSRPAVEDLFVE